MTSVQFRGQGIARRSGTVVSSLRTRGRLAVVTKVAVSNTPSRRAVEKAGFLPLAVVDLRRVLLHRRVTVTATDRDASWLRAALSA